MEKTKIKMKTTRFAEDRQVHRDHRTHQHHQVHQRHQRHQIHQVHQVHQDNRDTRITEAPRHQDTNAAANSGCGRLGRRNSRLWTVDFCMGKDLIRNCGV